tara:strand:+ start:1146 stop:1325 length:180 start_codon:yes stop_codon:yes gene_type:complete
MVLAQLERLERDSNELELYALRLKKKGRFKKMERILRKRDFIDERIKLIRPEKEYMLLK